MRFYLLAARVLIITEDFRAEWHPNLWYNTAASIPTSSSCLCFITTTFSYFAIFKGDVPPGRHSRSRFFALLLVVVDDNSFPPPLPRVFSCLWRDLNYSRTAQTTNKRERSSSRVVFRVNLPTEKSFSTLVKSLTYAHCRQLHWIAIIAPQVQLINEEIYLSLFAECIQLVNRQELGLVHLSRLKCLNRWV